MLLEPFEVDDSLHFLEVRREQKERFMRQPSHGKSAAGGSSGGARGRTGHGSRMHINKVKRGLYRLIVVHHISSFIPIGESIIILCKKIAYPGLLKTYFSLVIKNLN
jgi:hypothetical protein